MENDVEIGSRWDFEIWKDIRRLDRDLKFKIDFGNLEYF